MAEQRKQPFEILPKITSKSDIGIAGLGLASGYFLFAAFRPFGISPEPASLYTAIAALGIKNLLQAWLESNRAKRLAKIEPQATAYEKKARLDDASERMILYWSS